MKELLEKFQETVRKERRPMMLVLQGKRTEPRNNDGRRYCWWCGSPTKRVPGVIDVYDICTECGK
jgi:hypothetical protein